MKYRPEFPVRFESLQHAEAICQQFFSWYNKNHYHSGIALLTPESVHYARDQMILEQRHAVLMQAFLAHPERFNHRQPQLKKIPMAVYVNPPESVGTTNKSAVAESFFGGLKQERVQWRHYQTRSEAQLNILDYITMFYNNHRLHSYLEYRSPCQFEAEMLELKKVA